MKRLCLALVLVLMVSAAASAEHVRIGGFGGNDTIIVEEMLERFIRPALEGTGSRFPRTSGRRFPALYRQCPVSGDCARPFYVDIFWAESLMRSGVLEPLNSYLAESDILKPDHIIDSLLDAFTLDGSIYGIQGLQHLGSVLQQGPLRLRRGYSIPDENDTQTPSMTSWLKLPPSTGIYGLALQPEFARMGASAYAAGLNL